jgi:hypothetical protein
VLVLQDPGGEPLDRFLDQRRLDGVGLVQPTELSGVLRLAISLAAGLRKVHGQGLIHKDIIGNRFFRAR